MLRKILAIAVLLCGVAAVHRFVWLPHACNVAKGQARRQLRAALQRPDPYQQRIVGLRNVAALEDCLRHHPRDSELTVLVADSLMAAGRSQAAGELYCRTLAFAPTAEMHVACGNALLLAGDRTTALQHFVRAGEFGGPQVLQGVNDAEARWAAVRQAGALYEKNLLKRGDFSQPNLVINGRFTTVGPAGPSPQPGTGHSGAESWGIMNPEPDQPPRSQLLPDAGRNGGPAIRIATNVPESGLRQTLPETLFKPRVVVTAWVRVDRGTACLGASDGQTFITSTCSTRTGEWEKLETVNESCPAVAISILSGDAGGAEFLVDEVIVRETFVAPPCER